MKRTLVVPPIKQQQNNVCDKVKERHQKKLDNLAINKRINDDIQRNTSQAIKKLFRYLTK